MSTYNWDWSLLGRSLPYLAGGIATTAEVCAIATLATIPVSTFVAAARLSRFRAVRVVAAAYVDVFRATPFMIQLIWFYFVLPELIGRSPGSLWTAVMGLTLYISAYQSEVMRSGLQGLPKGQREAGLTLGMTRWQTFRRVLFPQAAKRVIPPSLNMLVILVKESSIVSVIAVTDIMWRSSSIASTSYHPVEPLTFAAVAYLVMVLPITLASRVAYSRFRLSFEA